MWKKEDAQPEPATTATPPRVPPPSPTRTGSRATIGPSISIRGEVTGSEDLLIEGRIDGSVSLESHAVAVGTEGRVHAGITGRVITIEGEVEGDLTAQEQIVLRGTARVHGDIKAPRVVLEDGATFRGLVDMSATPRGKNVQPEAGSATTGKANGADGTAASEPGPDTKGGGPDSGPSAPKSAQAQGSARPDAPEAGSARAKTGTGRAGATRGG